MPFLRNPSRTWLSAIALRPTTLSMTRSRTPSKVFFIAASSICLIILLMSCPLSALSVLRLEGLHHHRYARAHGRAQSDGLHIVAFYATRFGMANRVDEGGYIVGQLVFIEAHLADTGVHIATLVGAIFDFARLEILDCGGH